MEIRHQQPKTYLPLRFFDLAASANSIRRRIASDREGLSFCCLAQLSMASRVLGGRRTVKTGSWPVAGRPRFFGVTVIDSLAISVLREKGASEPMGSFNFPPALTQATEVTHGPG
jgi:hypothetical protein